MITRHELILSVLTGLLFGFIIGGTIGDHMATTRITHKLVQEELATKHAADIANMRAYEQLQEDTKKRVQAWVDNATKE